MFKHRRRETNVKRLFLNFQFFKTFSFILWKRCQCFRSNKKLEAILEPYTCQTCVLARAWRAALGSTALETVSFKISNRHVTSVCSLSLLPVEETFTIKLSVVASSSRLTAPFATSRKKFLAGKTNRKYARRPAAWVFPSSRGTSYSSFTFVLSTFYWLKISQKRIYK